MQARNEARVASSEIEEAKEWAQTLHISVAQLRVKDAEEKAELNQ